MGVREFFEQMASAERSLTTALGDRQRPGLRVELSEALRHMEAEQVAFGRDPWAMRAQAWKRVHVLRGLGYCVDDDWLRGPVVRQHCDETAGPFLTPEKGDKAGVRPKRKGEA